MSTSKFGFGLGRVGKTQGRLGKLFPEEEEGAAPITPPNGYVLEDGVTFYVAEDGTTFYVQEV